MRIPKGILLARRILLPVRTDTRAGVRCGGWQDRLGVFGLRGAIPGSNVQDLIATSSLSEGVLG